MDVAYLLAVAAAIRPKTQEAQRKMENVVNVVWIGPKDCSQFKGFFKIDIYEIRNLLPYLTDNMWTIPIKGDNNCRWRSFVEELDNEESQDRVLNISNPEK